MNNTLENAKLFVENTKQRTGFNSSLEIIKNNKRPDQTIEQAVVEFMEDHDIITPTGKVATLSTVVTSYSKKYAIRQEKHGSTNAYKEIETVMAMGSIRKEVKLAIIKEICRNA
jgi:hypothetical protein